MKRSKSKSKKCPACNSIIYGGNEQIVKHMMMKSKCKRKIMYCLGCHKPCADIIHLQNHQRQQQHFKVG